MIKAAHICVRPFLTVRLTWACSYSFKPIMHRAKRLFSGILHAACISDGSPAVSLKDDLTCLSHELVLLCTGVLEYDLLSGFFPGFRQGQLQAVIFILSLIHI